MRLRRWCKRLLLGALSAGSGAIIAACYGPMDDGYGSGQWEVAQGRVVSSAQQPVMGLQICARFYQAANACTTTGSDGYYLLESDQAGWQEAQDQGFELVVRDVDGAENGEYAGKDISVAAGLQLPVSMDITVEPLAR
ncbi:MAG: hypothetical protein FJ125_08805 [Deltaproteobacteria bacterium]|nr:hypothetical protein [Deltaproteobacteria bacterium]